MDTVFVHSFISDYGTYVLGPQTLRTVGFGNATSAISSLINPVGSYGQLYWLTCLVMFTHTEFILVVTICC